MISQNRILNNEQGTANPEVNYGYDSPNRLLSEASSKSASFTHSVVEYSYDLASNRLTKTAGGLEVSSVIL